MSRNYGIPPRDDLAPARGFHLAAGGAFLIWLALALLVACLVAPS